MTIARRAAPRRRAGDDEPAADGEIKGVPQVRSDVACDVHEIKPPGPIRKALRGALVVRL